MSGSVERRVDLWRFTGSFLERVHVEHLPFVWHEEPAQTQWHPAEPSPIIALIRSRRS